MLLSEQLLGTGIFADRLLLLVIAPIELGQLEVAGRGRWLR